MTLPTESNPTRGRNGVSYEWLVDVAEVPVANAEPVWIHYPDITALQPNPNLTRQDAGTYANKGKQDMVTTGENYDLQFNGKAVRNAAGEAHPALKLMFDSANSHLEGGDPDAEVILVRLYHHWIPELAWEYSASASWTRANTGNSDLEFFALTLQAKGDRKVITNPAIAGGGSGNG